MAGNKKWDTEHPYDASFSCGMLTIDGRRITAFIDDEDPFRVEEVVCAEMISSVNGNFTVARKPAFAKIVVTVIGGSDDEKILRKMFTQTLRTAKDIPTVKIVASNGYNTRYGFDRCVILGATPAFSVKSNGKIQGVRYVFGCQALHLDK